MFVDISVDYINKVFVKENQFNGCWHGRNEYTEKSNKCNNTAVIINNVIILKI